MARIMNGLKRGTTLLLKAVVLYSLLFAVDGYREMASANHIPILFAVLAMAALGVLSGILLATVMTIVVHPKHGFIAAARSFIEILGYVVAVAVAMWITHFVLTASAKKKAEADEKDNKAMLAANRKGAGNDETDR